LTLRALNAEGIEEDIEKMADENDKGGEESKQEAPAASAPLAYAVIRVGDHEHKVSIGDRLQVEWAQDNDSTIQKEVEFNEVLLTRGENGETSIGAPLVEGASVKAKVIGQKDGKKLICFKRSRRQGFHKKKGHRQGYLEVEIASIP